MRGEGGAYGPFARQTFGWRWGWHPALRALCRVKLHNVSCRGRLDHLSPAYLACGAQDHPAWSQDPMVCEEPAGHRGPHLDDGRDWAWSGPSPKGDSAATP